MPGHAPCTGRHVRDLVCASHCAAQFRLSNTSTLGEMLFRALSLPFESPFHRQSLPAPLWCLLAWARTPLRCPGPDEVDVLIMRSPPSSPSPLPSFFSQIRLSPFACPCLCVRSFRSSFLSDPTSYYPFPTVNPGGHIPFRSLPQTNTFLSFLSVLLRVQLHTLLQPLSSISALSSVHSLKRLPVEDLILSSQRALSYSS